MSHNIKYISVLFPDYNLDSLTYSVLDSIYISTGDIVQVPFRKIFRYGVVIDHDFTPDIDSSKIKSIIKKIDNYKLSEKQIKFIKQASEYYLGNLSAFLKMTIPIKNIETDLNYKSINVDRFDLVNLNEAQSLAYSQLFNFYQLNKFSTIVLNGITGSGKTEVYFKLIADILLNSNKQVLIILPEILLTTQLIEKFEKRFKFKPIIWHSSISPSKKNKYWHQIINNQARVIIGARSALFLPFENLGLIIVEEEHDNSYKQEDGVIYNARDMAILKAQIENILVLLVSATPSVETFANIISNKYQSIDINVRYKNLNLPEVKIIDLKKEIVDNNKWLSPSLIKEIQKTICDNNQVLLFLNRRGYAPLTLCKNCGFRFTCNNCTSWLVEHRSKKRLECHHCGNIKAIPKTCPNCNTDDSIISCGPGVERIAEEVKDLFPNANIAIMTKDTVKSVKDANLLIENILEKKTNIIIGTQLIAKGHHFPDLALVGVIDSDIGLAGGDLRAAERTFQLLEQVSGRAGRENTKGTTILQTFFPDNEVILSLSRNDKINFYNNELNIRKIGDMPPFSRLATILFSHHNETKLKNYVKDFIKNAPNNNSVSIFGPAEAYPFKIRNKYRYKILIQTPKKFNIQNFIRYWTSLIKKNSAIQIKIDIDPYNFI